MKTNLLLIATFLTTFGLSQTIPSAAAGTDFKSIKEVVTVEEVPSKFRDNEIQLDLFYTQVFGPATSGEAFNTGPGGGVAVNAIVARYFGIGVENIWYDNDNKGDYLLSGFLIARYPIESLSLAPYALFGGGAKLTNSTAGFGTVGLGFEHRWTPNVGGFVDGRWMYGAPNNAGILRSGVRFSF